MENERGFEIFDVEVEKEGGDIFLKGMFAHFSFFLYILAISICREATWRQRRRVEILLSKSESSNISQFFLTFLQLLFVAGKLHGGKEGGWMERIGTESVATSGSLSQHQLEPSVFFTRSEI